MGPTLSGAEDQALAVPRRVVLAVQDERVAAGPADHVLPAAVLRVDQVAPWAAVEVVGSAVARQEVVSLAAREGVVARASIDAVVAAVTAHHVVPAARLEVVAP